MNNIKPDIEKILFDLKRLNYDRRRIEQELDYSENYLDQILSKGGNIKVLNRLKQLQNAILYKEGKGIETKGGGSLSSEDMANKLIRIEAQQSVILGTQAEILAHLTDRSVPALLRQKANEVKTMEEELRGEHGTR